MMSCSDKTGCCFGQNHNQLICLIFLLYFSFMAVKILLAASGPPAACTGSLFHNIHAPFLHQMQYTLKSPVYKDIW